MQVRVQYDRVGGTYVAGERVAGVVVLNSSREGSHSGITLTASGTISIHQSPRGLGPFEACYQSVKPVVLFHVEIVVSPKGERLPSGLIELPFVFELRPLNPRIPLVETYNGVYVSCTYSAEATVTHMFGKTTSDPAPLQVICHGQNAPAPSLGPAARAGVDFVLSSDEVSIRRIHGAAPIFLIRGAIDRKLNDIDIPLSGWICVERCSTPITSLELQLIRVESCATAVAMVRESTEVQNIQVGDGDVPRGLRIPLYMFFPRWYTCPTLKSPNLRVEFEVNVVVTLIEHNQIVHNVPLGLYRAHKE